MNCRFGYSKRNCLIRVDGLCWNIHHAMRMKTSFILQRKEITAQLSLASLSINKQNYNESNICNRNRNRYWQNTGCSYSCAGIEGRLLETGAGWYKRNG